MEKKDITRNQKTEKGGKNGGDDWKEEHKQESEDRIRRKEKKGY